MSQLLTINRKKWYRGKGGRESRLLLADFRSITTPTEPNPNAGKMCCLGFYCVSLGATANQIKDKAFPSDLTDATIDHQPELVQALGWLTDFPEAEEKRVAYPDNENEDIWENVIGGTNDDLELSEEDRESRLVELFALKGIAVTFTDDEAPQAA